MMLMGKLVKCKQDGKTKKKKSHFYSSDLLFKEKQLWAVLTDFIFIIPFCSIFLFLGDCFGWILIDRIQDLFPHYNLILSAFC